jgi:hypothetical protein
MNQTKYNIRFGVKKYHKGLGYNNYIIGEYRLGKPIEQSNFKEQITLDLEGIGVRDHTQQPFDCATYIRDIELCESVDIQGFNNNQDSSSHNGIYEAILKGSDNAFSNPISLRLATKNKSDLDETKPKIEEMSLDYEQKEQSAEILKEVEKFCNNNGAVPVFSSISDQSYEGLNILSASRQEHSSWLKLNNSDGVEGDYVMVNNRMGDAYINNNLTLTDGNNNVNCLGENPT